MAPRPFGEADGSQTWLKSAIQLINAVQHVEDISTYIYIYISNYIYIYLHGVVFSCMLYIYIYIYLRHIAMETCSQDWLFCCSAVMFVMCAF